MTAPQAVGTPVVAPVSVAAAEMGAAREAASTNEATGEDIVADARAEARKLLFSDKEEPETPTETEEPKVETKPEEPKSEEKKDERSEDEIALSKQWKRFRQDRKEFDAKVKADAQRAEDLTRREAALKEREEKHADPIAYLSAMGWSKDRIVEFIQSDGKVDPEILIKQLGDKHQRELEELRAERQREQEALKNERTARELENLKSQLDSEVSAMVKEDDFKLLQRFTAKKGEAGVQKRVRDIIAEVWNKKKEVVDPRDVLVYLENELAEIQLGDAPGQLPAVQSAKAAAAEPRPITNQSTSQRTVIPSNYDEEDPEARRERAQKILRGEIEE